MKKTDLQQIIKEEFNKILAEAKIFDNPKELISGVDKFLSDLYVNKTTNWRTSLNNIIEQEAGYLTTANQVTGLIDQVKKELNIINNFDKDIQIHKQEYDDIFQKSGELNPQDDKIYDELDELDSKIYKVIDQLEEYISNLEELSKHYEDLDGLITYFRRYKFKI
jgi:DNA repair exonuclease SbcCD ATPase subunit